jgi:hypothetical protein
MKKKAVALLLALSLAMSAMPVFGADFRWEATVSSTNVNVGDVFNLDFDVLENPGIQSSTIHITYDPSVVLPVTTVDPADDLISYQSKRGYEVPLFDYNYIDTIISNANVSSGELAIGNITMEADENNMLVEITETGTLARVTFKAVGEGDAKLALGSIYDVTRTPKISGVNMAYSIDIPDVVVGSGNSSSSSSQTTTTASTSSTSTSSTSSTNTSSTSTSSTSKTTTTTTTTTTTEATTAAAVEDTTETTTVAQATTSSSSAFTDLADYPWAESYINTLAQAKIVSGYNDNTFKPGNNVKRADFIIMLLKAIGVDTTVEQQSNFTDVSKDKYYYNAVAIAKEMGIASGNPDGTFNPESNITRQDMMILAKKAVELKLNSSLTGDSSVLDKFADKETISPYAVDSLAAMVNAGIVNGTGNNIQPKDNTTRAQAAVIICKILDMLK